MALLVPVLLAMSLALLLLDILRHTLYRTLSRKVETATKATQAVQAVLAWQTVQAHEEEKKYDQIIGLDKETMTHMLVHILDKDMLTKEQMAFIVSRSSSATAEQIYSVKQMGHIADIFSRAEVMCTAAMCNQFISQYKALDDQFYIECRRGD